MSTVLKSRLSFIFMLIIGLIIVMQMSFFVVHQIWQINVKWDIFQYCLSVFQEATRSHSVAKILFNGLIAYTGFGIILRIIQQIYLSRKWLRRFESQKNLKWTKKINYKYRTWNFKFLVVNDDTLVALTMGIIRPRIIISTRLLDMFTDKEVEAILLHERYHCEHFDPLKTTLITILFESMNYVPVMKMTAGFYRTTKELLADRFAVQHMGTVHYLGKVLLRFSDLSQLNRRAVGVYFADRAINYRIMQVLDPHKPIQVPFLSLKSVAGSVSVIAIMLGMAFGGCV